MILSLFPFLLLTLAVVSVLICQKTNQELIRMLTATIAGVVLIWGLAIAHWLVQLSLFILILVIFQPINLKTINKPF